MSDIPSDLLYTKTHEWVREETEDLCTIGITDIAQGLLGELVFVELPAVGKHFSQGEECAVVESVKAASDVYLPLDGTIEEVNQALIENPELINSDPYELGWLFKIRLSDPKQLSDMLTPQEYEEIAEEEAA
jgi:glycine cleavage system H protein